ncbi:hypothetical protein TRIUR3_27129 [Triticum urartu]|uniref:Uncharacterized protein n=1 Tax=Triticum urartu TaxID=4572 RepID=M8AC25_TRIUA|nr:hypothetical protein TRIUR3_27129 [Triticum urartu]
MDTPCPAAATGWYTGQGSSPVIVALRVPLTEEGAWRQQRVATKRASQAAYEVREKACCWEQPRPWRGGYRTVVELGARRAQRQSRRGGGLLQGHMDDDGVGAVRRGGDGAGDDVQKDGEVELREGACAAEEGPQRAG